MQALGLGVGVEIDNSSSSVYFGSGSIGGWNSKGVLPAVLPHSLSSKPGNEEPLSSSLSTCLPRGLEVRGRAGPWPQSSCQVGCDAECIGYLLKSRFLCPFPLLLNRTG